MAKKTTRKTTKKRKVPTRRTKQLTIAEIQGQLKARDREVQKLRKRRKRLIETVEQIERDIFAISGEHAEGSRRPRNASNLGDALVELLSGKEMTVTEATQAVQDAGYQTTASNFRTIVNQRLISDKRIKKIRRGVYTTKKR